MLKRTENGSYEYEISVKDFFDSIKKFWALILVVAIVAAVGVFAYFHFTYVPTYTATVQIIVYNSDMEDSSGISDNYEFDKAEKLTTSYMDILMKSTDYLEKIVDEYDLDTKLGYTPEILRSKISVSLVGTSGNYFQISVRDRIASSAAFIVDAVVNTFKSDIVYAGNVRTFGEGPSPEELPTDSSKAPSMAIIAFVIVAVVMLFAITFIRVKDTRIHTADDVAEIFDYPILGTIPCIDKLPLPRTENASRRVK